MYTRNKSNFTFVFQSTHSTFTNSNIHGGINAMTIYYNTIILLVLCKLLYNYFNSYFITYLMQQYYNMSSQLPSRSTLFRVIIRRAKSIFSRSAIIAPRCIRTRICNINNIQHYNTIKSARPQRPNKIVYILKYYSNLATVSKKKQPSDGC